MVFSLTLYDLSPIEIGKVVSDLALKGYDNNTDKLVCINIFNTHISYF